MPTPQLRVARPAFLIDDRDQPALSSGLVALAIREDCDGLAALEATFNNWGERDGVADLLYADRRLLDFGKRVEVRLDDASLFRGWISGLEGVWGEGTPPTLTVLAEDALQDLRMTRRTRTFEQQSDRDVLAKIAGEHGLSVDADIDGPSWPVLAQVNQSDLAFLRDRSRLAGFELWVRDRTVVARTRPARGGAALRLERGAQVLEFRVLADLAHQATRFAVCGWDPHNKEAVRVEAGDAALGAELGQDESGAAILRRARGERTQSTVHTLPPIEREARAQAEAQFRALARRFVCGEGRAEANPELRVGRVVELVGFGATFEGRYAVVEVVHRFDAQLGLRTEFRVERPGVGRAS